MVSLHTSIAAVSAFRGCFKSKAVEPYGRLSGANACFGFFAPGVANGIRIEATLTSSDGSQLIVTPREMARSIAGRSRIENLMNFYLSASKENMRELGKELGAHLLGVYPASVSVELRVQVQTYPSLWSPQAATGEPEKNLFSATYKRPPA